MPTFLYWCENVITGETYHFMSQALLSVGITIKDEDGNDCRIVDMAAEFPLISVEDDHINYELARAMSM